MRGKSYLAIGSVCMGSVDLLWIRIFSGIPGMRNEYVDSSEVLRRIEKKIYDEEEFRKPWHGQNKLQRRQ